MQATDLLEIISDLAGLKGFPRSDGQALIAIAEGLIDIVRPKQGAPDDDVLRDRAARIVRQVLITAPEWRGPAQFETAACSLAEANQRWDIPREWTKTPVHCSDCTDTGAVQLADGTFALCLCSAGEGLDALNHVASLNDCVRRVRELRQRAAQAHPVSPAWHDGRKP